jgi:hypothetical protein
MASGTGCAPADNAELEEAELKRVKLPEAKEDMVDWEILDMMAATKGNGEDNSQQRVRRR